MFNSFRILKFKDALNPKIGAFIKKNHYSGSVSRGNKFVYILLVNNKMRGVATFGTPVGNRVEEFYGGQVLECKRFCLAPNAPKNAASFFMGHCLRDLKKRPNISKIISYADPEVGHEGIIYRASNFKYLGQQAKATQAVKFEGKVYHSRVVWGRNAQGEYKETAKTIQYAMKKGLAKNIYLMPKHIYLFNFKK